MNTETNNYARIELNLDDALTRHSQCDCYMYLELGGFKLSKLSKLLLAFLFHIFVQPVSPLTPAVLSFIQVYIDSYIVRSTSVSMFVFPLRFRFELVCPYFLAN